MKARLEMIDVSHSRQMAGNRNAAEGIRSPLGNERAAKRNGNLSEEYKRQQRIAARRKREKERKRKLRQIYSGIACFLCIAAAGLGVGIVKTIQAKSVSTPENTTPVNANNNYEKIAQSYQPNKPKTMEKSEALEMLKELTKEYPEFQSFCEQPDLYPEKLLIALCNNPEMYDFVKGYPEADDSTAGEITKQELEEDYPLFLQWDERWGYYSYGDSMIGLTGCGPTCLSMAAVALTGDESITPAAVASFSMKNGYYVEGTGTAWSLMTDGAKNFGMKAVEISLDETVMKNYLDRGRPIICSVGPGDFTAAGHFIVIYGYDEEGFKVNDPNCIARSEKHWTYRELSGQIRILWAYSTVNA